jgi:hypothetical protein
MGYALGLAAVVIASAILILQPIREWPLTSAAPELQQPTENDVAEPVIYCDPRPVGRFVR